MVRAMPRDQPIDTVAVFEARLRELEAGIEAALVLPRTRGVAEF